MRKLFTAQAIQTPLKKISLLSATVLLLLTSSGMMPQLLNQQASALSLFSQDFSSDTTGWVTDGGYGTITATGGYGVVTGESSGPFTRFDGYKKVWPGTFTTSVDVQLDPNWAAGSGFDYSVAANGTDNAHQRDFVFNVAKDTSEDKLLVGASTGSAFTPRENLELGNNYEVTTAGWYTLQHTFRNNSGQLEVDLELIQNGTVLFTATLTDAQDTIPAAVGGNRYGWFTFVDVAGGLQIDNSTINVESVATVTSAGVTSYYDSLQSALAGAVVGDVVTLLEDVTLTSTLLDLNKANLTLNGNGHTIKTTYAKGVNGVANAALQVSANGVAINDLRVESDNATPAHGINVFASDDVTLTNITVKNNAIGVVVNDSEVTIDGISSEGSKWGHAINVDKGDATLTITGTNSWNEPRFIYVDNIAVGSVEDFANQYKQVLVPNLNNPAITAAIYALPSTPVTTKLTATIGGDGVGSATTPVTLTIGSPAAYVEIPAGTVITGTGWDGTVLAPETTTASVAIPGYTVNDLAAVKVGADGIRLNFSQPVSINLPGQQGKLAGFVDHLGVFHPITTPCGADVNATLTGSVEECWTEGGGDLVIWTTHFTTFVAYNRTAVVSTPSTTPTSTVTKRAVASNFVASLGSNVASVLGVAAESGAVKGTATDKGTPKVATTQKPEAGRFLGLGWFWLPVLAVVFLAVYYGLLARRADKA